MVLASTLHLDIADERQMHAVAARLASATRAGLLMTLAGELAAGKTSFVRGFLRGLGYGGLVKSPTFTLVESYSLPDFVLHHFDLYRLIDPHELDYFGFDDYVRDDTVCLIEWPVRAGALLPRVDVALDIDVVGDERRTLHFHGYTLAGRQTCQSLVINPLVS